MESLFDAWGKRNPEWEKKYTDILMEPFTEYGKGTNQYSASRGKIYGAGYEMFIIGFFIGLYFDKTRKLPDDKAKRKHFGHPIMFWGSLDGKAKLGRTSYKKIQEYMFVALVAKTDINFIALDKGELPLKDAVDILMKKMEEYANYGFHYLEDMLDDDPNCLFKDSAFLKIFTSFLDGGNNEEGDDELESFAEDEPESYTEDSKEIDSSVDEEQLRKEAEKPWDELDIDRLKLYFDHKLEIDAIAERLGKSVYAVQYQLSKLGLIKMPLNVSVKNSEMGGVICNKSGDIVYRDDAILKIFHEGIYRFNFKPMCITVKEIIRKDGTWDKGGKVLVAYTESELFNRLSKNNIDDIDDFVIGESREKNKIKVLGVWYNYYGDRIVKQ